MTDKLVTLHLYIPQKDVLFLKEMPGSISSHIRLATEAYITAIKSSQVSKSLSERSNNG